MLGGIDPILIFDFSKLSATDEESLSKIPIISSIVSKIGLPPIPIYLSEKLTGLYIDSEDKNIDIETTTETLPDGSTPLINQKAINSTIRINLVAHRDSIGLTLLSAVCDLILPKVTSREYSITYLHGAVTVFAGLLHSFSINQNTQNELMNVTLEIVKTPIKPVKKGPPEVKPISESVPLGAGPAAPPPTAPLGGPGSVGLKGPPPQPPKAAPVTLNGPG